MWTLFEVLCRSQLAIQRVLYTAYQSRRATHELNMSVNTEQLTTAAFNFDEVSLIAEEVAALRSLVDGDLMTMIALRDDRTNLGEIERGRHCCYGCQRQRRP